MKQRTPLIASILSALALTGCAGPQSVSLGTDDPCQSLHEVVADYPSGFADFRGKASNFNLLTVYRAKEQIIDGECEIWAWNQQDTAYACTVTAPSQDVAAQRHERTRDFIQSCLGNAWRASDVERIRDGEAGGIITRFSSPESPAMVSVHSIIRTTGAQDQRSTALYIGSPARIDSLTE
ncbi:hypothetical protein [Marinobacter fonticola]|uniref:hypothetical protein n=1 Tax=Marinobacter fonticola TaxID=2603215 RepID=UPI0011E6447E|nr:hypothetical protein [Marinobacter fonticola]